MKPKSSTPETNKRTDRQRADAATASAARAEGTVAEGREEGAEAAAAGQTAGEALDERMSAALYGASDKKALGLLALDLRPVASFTDVFLIASGTNVRQVQAIADEVVERLKKEHGARPARVEGYNTGEWVLLDYGDFIFHVFEEKARRFYDLERLWRDAARVALPPELAAEGGGVEAAEGSLRKRQ